MKKILTHNGKFHADDCFATSALQIYFEKIGEPVQVIRSRDELVTKSADIVYDTGYIYDPEKNRFDHHQEGGAGNRKNGVPYASFGLIWKHYGGEICDSERVANMVDEQIVQCIDASDCGYEMFESLKGIKNFAVDSLIGTFNPNRLEQKKGDDENMQYFEEAVALCKRILERQIEKTKLAVLDEEEVEAIYEKTEDKRIIIFDKQISWQNSLCKKPEPLYVVQTRYGEDYAVTAVPVLPGSSTLRKAFPAEWRGKSGGEMVRASGVKTANFCHLAGFLCITSDRDGAIDLAKKAVEMP